MNRENIKKAADYVFNLPEDYDGFDMGVFPEHGTPAESARTCGTAGCFVGHWPQAGIRPRRDEEWDEYSERVSGFDLGSPEWDWLFSEDWCVTDNTPRGAAQRAYWLLDHGLPADWTAQMFGLAPLCYTNKNSTETTSKLIGTLASLCYELNAPDYHVFFDYSGHVDTLSVSVSPGGWTRDEVPLRVGAACQAWESGLIEKIISDLQKHHDNYRKGQQQ